MKSRAWSGSKLFDTFMEFLKSAEDIARHSITAFCHVHKGDFGFEVDKECFNFWHQRSCQTYFYMLWALMPLQGDSSEQTRQVTRRHIGYAAIQNANTIDERR